MSDSKRVAFMHDHRFFRDANYNYYSEGKLGYAILKRYLALGDELIVLSRCTEVHSFDHSKYVVASGESVEFKPLRGSGWVEILLLSLFYNFIETKRLISGVDIVVMRLPSVISLLAFPICLLLRKSYVVEVVGDARESIKSSSNSLFGRYLLSYFFYIYTKFVVSKARGAIYVTRFDLQKRYPNRGITGIASNVSIECTGRHVLEGRLDKIQSLGADIVEVGIIASYQNRYKGIEVLVMATSILRSRYNINATVRMLGSGDSEFLADIISKNNAEEWFFHEGVLPSADIPVWLDSIDLYCQPSLTEGLPRALIEAMSRGCPCVGSRVGGIPEILSEFSMVDPGNCCQLAERLYQFLSSKDVLIREANANFVKAREYSSDLLAARRDEFFSRVSKTLD